MSFCDARGVQIEHDELDAPSLTAEDAWAIVRVIEASDGLPEHERRRLWFAVVDAHLFGPALGGALPPVSVL